MEFSYEIHLYNLTAFTRSCPIIDDFETEVTFLRHDEMPSPKFKKKVLREARKIRKWYAQLLARGVGGSEYATLWKRNLVVMDRIIEGHLK